MMEKNIKKGQMEDLDRVIIESIQAQLKRENEKTIAEVRREKARGTSLYFRTAAKFGVSYTYVAELARGKRQGTRGKGKQIKEFLLSELCSN